MLTYTLLTDVLHTQFPRKRWLKTVIVAPGEIITIVRLGLFEANATQFGLDQLLEVPTQKLISFIHWYYWSQNVAGLAMFYMIGGGTIVTHEFEKSNIKKLS